MSNAKTGVTANYYRSSVPCRPSTASIVVEEVLLVGNHYKFTLATDINYRIIIRGGGGRKMGKEKDWR